MNNPHKSQSAAMDRAGELPDCEQLRECINSGQVSAAQVVAGAVRVCQISDCECSLKCGNGPCRQEIRELSKRTGWPAGLLQDDSRQLSKALSRDPNARALVREWKVGNELLPFHHQASHVNPDYRDGWNAAYYAAIAAKQEEVARLLEMQEKYQELIFAVARKFPGESRHETALRYINQAENNASSGPSSVLNSKASS